MDMKICSTIGYERDHNPTVLPLAPRQVEQRRAAGAVVVDVRTDQQFDEAHIPGAACVPMLRAGFGCKLAWVADREQPIVLVGRDDHDGHHAAPLAVAVGMRNLAGLLAGGMTSWRQEGRPTASLVARFGAEQVLRVVGGGVPKLGRLGQKLERADPQAD